MNNQLLESLNTYIANARRTGARIFAYTTPCCGKELHTTVPKDSQVWDSLTSCPYCHGLFMKVCRFAEVTVRLLPQAEARDPRIDPQQGDRVTVSNETREVERVDGDRVIYSWPGKVAVCTMYIDAWRAWAAGASSYQAVEAQAA